MSVLTHIEEALLRQTIDNTPPFSLEGLTTSARVVDVVDGDSIKLILPVFDKFFVFNARLYGIDTPEIKSKDLQERRAAIAARDRLIAELMINSQSPNATSQLSCANKKQIRSLFGLCPCIIQVTCKHFDKYGRLLVDIAATAKLLNDGLGYSYDGGTKQLFLQSHSHAATSTASAAGS